MIDEVFHIITDPAHIFAELFFIMIEAAILTPFIAWGIKVHDRRKHGRQRPLA